MWISCSFSLCSYYMLEESASHKNLPAQTPYTSAYCRRAFYALFTLHEKRRKQIFRQIFDSVERRKFARYTSVDCFGRICSSSRASIPWDNTACWCICFRWLCDVSGDVTAMIKWLPADDQQQLQTRLEFETGMAEARWEPNTLVCSKRHILAYLYSSQDLHVYKRLM